jgi:hypothetical protein
MTTTMKRARIGLLAAALAGAPLANAPAAEPARVPPVPVSELVVDGGAPPRVVASFPAEGGTVPAGVLVIKLVFDQPMTADGWSYGRAEAGAFPDCLARPRLLADRRTFVLLCSTASHKTYALEVNAAPAFVSAAGRVARPVRLNFSTAETGAVSLGEALAQAGLTAADEPIMTWRDGGVGVSRSPPAK